jgi:hypothetical protein
LIHAQLKSAGAAKPTNHGVVDRPLTFGIIGSFAEIELLAALGAGVPDRFVPVAVAMHPKWKIRVRTPKKWLGHFATCIETCVEPTTGYFSRKRKRRF